MRICKFAVDTFSSLNRSNTLLIKEGGQNNDPAHFEQLHIHLRIEDTYCLAATGENSLGENGDEECILIEVNEYDAVK